MPTGNIKVENSNNLNAAVGIYGEKQLSQTKVK